MVFNLRFFMRASILQQIILAWLHHLSLNRPNVHDIIDFKLLSLIWTEIFIIDLHPNFTTSTLLVWFFLEIDPPLRNRSWNWNGRGPKVYFVTVFFLEIFWNIPRNQDVILYIGTVHKFTSSSSNSLFVGFNENKLYVRPNRAILLLFLIVGSSKPKNSETSLTSIDNFLLCVRPVVGLLSAGRSLHRWGFCKATRKQ